MSGLADVGAVRTEPRRGAARWLHAYLAMLRWHLASLRLWAATAIAFEILAGVGLVFGIGLLIPHISSRAALYGTTGAAVIALLLIGLIVGPQLVAEQKTAGTYEYLLTLPVPRAASALAWYTVALLIGLPAAILTLVAGVLRYGVSLSVSPELLPAVLLGVFATTMLGYAIAHASPRPMLTLLLTQLLVLLAFGYAPINFPASQMPAWLVDINRALPLLPTATTVRDGLTHRLAGQLALSYLVLAIWAVGSVCLAVLALRRRG